MRLRVLTGNNAIDPLSLLCLKAVGILCMKEKDGVGPHSILCSSGSLCLSLGGFPWGLITSHLSPDLRSPGLGLL